MGFVVFVARRRADHLRLGSASQFGAWLVSRRER